MSKRNLQATVTIGGALASSFKSMIGGARSQIDGLGSSIGQLTSRQKELNATIRAHEKLGVSGSALRVSYAQQELAVIGSQIEAIKKRNSVLAKGAERRDIGGSMMMSGGLMIGGAVASAITLGKPIKESSELEHKLQLIGNTANMTKSEIGTLKDQIFAVSKASNKSTDDVTAGIGFLIAAGMEAKTATATIGTIAKASTATGAVVEDLAKAAFTLNDSLNINPENIKGALNIMAQAGKEGNVELRDMAKQLPVLGAGFKSLKMEGKEATATIGAALQIARKGASDADEAANNMKNFVAKIMSPETLKKAQKHFGVDLYKIIKEAQTKGENPFEASMKAIIKMTKGDQKAIGELFADMQVQNFLRPMIDQWSEYERIKRKALTSNDIVEEDFAKMMTTVKEQTQGMGNAWTRLMTTMGDTSAPVIGETSKSLAGLFESMQLFSKQNPETVRNIMQATGVVIGLTVALGVGKLAVGGLIYAWGAVPAIIGAAGTALTWLAGTALPAVATALRVVALAATVTPVGRMISLLVMGATLVAANWESVTKVFNAVGDAIGGAWNKAKSFFGFGDSSAINSTSSPSTSSINMVPPTPAIRIAGGNTTTHVTSAPVITIHQQPGQDAGTLANEVIRKIDEREGIKRRSIMFDRQMGY
jgi:TP901 family phage tail tape measure protein